MNGVEFRETRNRLDLTIADLAKMLDVTERTVFRWQDDRSRIPGPVALSMRLLVKLTEFEAMT